ncbi:MAG: enoyl-CoA hydratase/isomerase family protein, partial [Bdellovibrionales bacterium]|nr:enoyl-CoA hydratase/isomerase family protein [Bdellovibrionales bacterium]
MESAAALRSPTTGRVYFVEEEGITLLYLGAPDEKVITFTTERMASLREAISLIAAKPPKGVVITGNKPGMFAAGADIHSIGKVQDAIVGEELGKEGQSVFQMIEDLPCITVAAISGPAVGGGCELSLSCTYRIISDDGGSQIGLPETKLGILPGWGGTQRLPRLVGIRQALGIILQGKNLRPQQALKVGLVNEVVSPEALLDRARQIAQRKSTPTSLRLSLADRFFTFTQVGRFLVRKQAETEIQKETKGNYPAPPAALKTILLGLQSGTKVGYQQEARELGRLLTTPESRALVNLFFLSEGSKRLGR